MKSEAIVMTFDLGSSYFSAIVLDKQLRLISSNGTIISLPNKVQKPVIEKTGQLFKSLNGFFKADNI